MTLLIRVVLASALLVGCKAGDPDKDTPVFVVYVRSPPGGTFTVSHRNAAGAGSPSASYVGSGSFQEVVITRFGGGGVDPSLQEVRGSFTGADLVVGFGTRQYGGGSSASAGAESGSLQSVEGPHQETLPCQVRYGPSAVAGSTYSVKFRFTADAGRACANP